MLAESASGDDDEPADNDDVKWSDVDVQGRQYRSVKESLRVKRVLQTLLSARIASSLRQLQTIWSTLHNLHWNGVRVVEWPADPELQPRVGKVGDRRSG